MGENSGDHRGLFDGGNDFQGAATVRTVFNVDIEYPFEQPGPADTGRSRLKGRATRIIRGII